MKTFLVHALFFVFTLSLHACWLATQSGTAPSTTSSDPNTLDPNARLVAVAQTLADDIFEGSQPRLNAEVAKLPPDVQLLAQAAYAALQHAVDTAAARGVGSLDPNETAAATKALGNLASLSDALHAALHLGDARAPSPDAATPAPAALSVPTPVAP